MMRFADFARAAVPVLLLALSGALAPDVEAAGKRAARIQTSLDLHLAQPREAEKLEVTLPDPAASRLQRRPVSDLLLLATAIDGRGIDDVLAIPDGDPSAMRPLMSVRLLAVVGGRIIRHGRASCSGWLGDTSACKLGCDGGRFGLRRVRTAEETTLRLIVGVGGGEVEGEGGLLISACERDSGPEMRLVPSGGRATAEVALSAD